MRGFLQKRYSDATQSAYRYSTGKGFHKYAAEQIAEQVEDYYVAAFTTPKDPGKAKAREAIVKHIRSVAPHTHDSNNAASLSTWRWETAHGTHAASGPS